ncbi:MAG: UbiA family prenyltransferase [bacterium]|nr:UbiA family prenyltransferase [bacterium]
MKLLDFVFAARPMLQLPIWTVYLVALHYHHQLSGGSFDWNDLAIMACISLLASGAAYLNQVFDYESDLINKKLGFLQNGLLKFKQLQVGFIIACVIPLFVAPMFSQFTFFLFAQLVFLSFVYSAPPLRLKDRAFWGLIANAWSYGFLVALAIMPEITIHNGGLLGWDNPLYFFLAVAATHILTTIPDREGDAATNKKTIAVVLNRRSALLIALALLLLAVWLAYRSDFVELALLALIAAALVLVAVFIKSDRPVLLAAKMPLLLLTCLAGYFFPVYVVFVVALLIACRIYYRQRFGVVYPRLM